MRTKNMNRQKLLIEGLNKISVLNNNLTYDPVTDEYYYRNCLIEFSVLHGSFVLFLHNKNCTIYSWTVLLEFTIDYLINSLEHLNSWNEQ